MFVSCRNDISLNPKFFFNNDSDIKIDSLVIRDFTKNNLIIYDIEPHTKIIKTINMKGKIYPENDGVAFEVFVFSNDVFFSTAKGIIDPPFSNVKEQYDFILWNEGLGYYVSDKKFIRKSNLINDNNLKKAFYYGKNWRE